MSPHPQVSVIVVNYNGASCIRECLHSFLAQQPVVGELVVVDNHSSDFSADVVEREFPDVRLIRMPDNCGYGAALNRGIRETSGPVVVVANNDLTVCEGWVHAVVGRLEGEPRCGQVASKVLYLDEPDTLNSTGTLLYADLSAVNRGLDEKDEGQYETAEEVFGAYGAIMAFRREVFDDVGLFDEEYFLFKEEDDITLRMHRAGWTAVYEPRARVLHRRSAATGIFSPLKLYYSERNRIWNVVKHMPWYSLVTTIPAAVVRYGANAALGLRPSSPKGEAVAGTSKRLLALTILRAWVDALRGMGAMVSKRRAHRSALKLSCSQTASLVRRFRARLSDMVR